MKLTQQGVTLIEILLVLTIAAIIYIIGFQQYASFRNYQYAAQAKINVDTLFQAAANYYRANCIQYVDNSGTTVKQGTLDPDAMSSILNQFPLNINNDLSQPGFLSKWPFVANPLVSTDADNYVVQFNLTTQPRKQSLSDGTSQTIGTLYLWKIQVSMMLSTQAAKNPTTYLQLLGADCLSTFDGTVVTPCTSSSSGNYLVWERLPSFSAPNSSTPLWLMAPTVNQFNQQYNTYPMKILTNGTIGNQNFLCNS